MPLMFVFIYLNVVLSCFRRCLFYVCVNIGCLGSVIYSFEHIKCRPGTKPKPIKRFTEICAIYFDTYGIKFFVSFQYHTHLDSILLGHFICDIIIVQWLLEHWSWGECLSCILTVLSASEWCIDSLWSSGIDVGQQWLR